MAKSKRDTRKTRDSGKKKTPSKKDVVLWPKRKGQEPIRFKRGGLHESLGVPEGERIPDSKMQAALRGEYGEKARKQAQFAQTVLQAGRHTAQQRRKRKKSK